MNGVRLLFVTEVPLPSSFFSPPGYAVHASRPMSSASRYAVNQPRSIGVFASNTSRPFIVSSKKSELPYRFRSWSGSTLRPFAIRLIASP